MICTSNTHKDKDAGFPYHLLPFSKFRRWIQNVRCDQRLQHAPLQHRRGAPAIVHHQPGLGSRRRSQPLPQDCGWQGERCAGSPARTPYLSSPWSPRGMPTSSWKCSPAAWSTPPPLTASWSWTPGMRCCSAGSLEEAPSGKPASPTAPTHTCC